MVEKLKLMLGFSPDDTTQDARLNNIVVGARQRLKILLGGIEPPPNLDYIIQDVSLARFNRIGSEGLDSHTVEGESLSFTENDFKGYADDIQAFLDCQKDTARGKVRFL